MTENPITSGQKRTVEGIIHAALEGMLKGDDLDKVRMQRLIDRGEKLTAGMQELFLDLSRENAWEKEEIEAAERNYLYPAQYGVKPIAEQVAILTRYFPELETYDKHGDEWPLPRRAEGPYAIPKWTKVAGTYRDAVIRVARLIEKTERSTFEECDVQLARTVHTAEVLDQNFDGQRDHDIRIVPAQFGRVHAGRSARRTREVYSTREFGLGAFEVGCMFLTHPGRLGHVDWHWIGCPGDDATLGEPLAEMKQEQLVPCLIFSDGKMRFAMSGMGKTAVNLGYATGFVIGM